MDPDTATAVSAALSESNDWYTVASKLRQNELGAELAPHIAAFSYMFVERTNTDYRTRYGPLAPMIESATGVYPAPLDQLRADAIAPWGDAFESIEAPLLRSRYGDLLWLCRHGSTAHRYGELAVEAYEVLAGGDDELLTATHATQRGMELGLELNDQAAARRLGATAVTHASAMLAVGRERPGVVMRLLEAVVGLPPALRPDPLLGVALVAEQTYEADPWLGDAVADLLAALTADPVAREQIRRRQLARWQAATTASDGLVRQSHLQHALELAALHQLSDVREGLRRQLQNLRDAPLGLHQIAGEVTIPRAELERMTTGILGDDTAIDALRRLAGLAPTGDPADNRSLAEQIMQNHPIQFLMTRVIVSDDNIPIRYLRTRDEHLEAQLARQEMMRIRLFASTILEPALDAIVDRYGSPSEAAIGEALTGGPIDATLATRFGAAIAQFFEGANDRSAHAMVPRLERALRELARQAGVIVVREPAAAMPGGVRSLGPILADLEGILPDDWRRYFVSLLTDELGINLRNRIAHGLVDEVQRQDAALLVHAAFALSLFRSGAPDSPR
jgi:hypothetical protein